MAADSKLVFNELASDPELLNDFIVESGEHLSAVEQQLLALDRDAKDQEALHAIFRGFHTIKGLAGFLGLDAIQEVAHEVETLLDLARNGQIRFAPEHIDLIFASKDHLSAWLRALRQMADGGRLPEIGDNQALLARIAQMSKPPEDPVPAALNGLSQAQERETPAQRTNSQTDSIKVDTRKLDYLVDMLGEMAIAQSLVEHEAEHVGNSQPGLSRNLTQLARITGEVQRTAVAMRMVPVRSLFGKMSRLVRDLSRKTGKPIELRCSGEETELDRGIVENLADPMMHMVRNAVDHGIETPEERARAGKNPVARILLKAGHQSGQITVQVADDGRGLDAGRILRKGRERGLVKPGAQLSESEIFNLIFSPGFSTAEQVTSVSGRGVGMDVVKKQIQKLRGKIEIQSKTGAGAAFFLKVPLTLAIIDGLLVGVGNETYVLPLFAVREMFKPAEDLLATIENRDEMALVRGSLVPVVRLERRFGVRSRFERLRDSVLIVVEAGDRRFCLAVDELIGKQEVVIKSLGGAPQARGVSGGAILGDGRVGLILDPEGLFGQGPA